MTYKKLADSLDISEEIKGFFPSIKFPGRNVIILPKRQKNLKWSEWNLAFVVSLAKTSETQLFFGSNKEKTCQIFVYIQLCTLLQKNLLIFSCVWLEHNYS